MTNREKDILQYMVRNLLGADKKDSEIIEELVSRGYEKVLIKKYIKAFKNT